MSIRSLCASVLAHAAAVLLVLAAQFPRESSPPELPRHVTLLAPAPERVRTRKAEIPVRSTPRLFQARLTQPAVTMPALALELPPALLPAAAVPPESAPQLPRLNSPEPAIPATFKTTPNRELKASGFSSAEMSAGEPSHKGAIAAAGFDTAVQAAPGHTRRDRVEPGGFSAGGTPIAEAPARRGSVRRSDFGDSSIAVPALGNHHIEVSGFAPVEITFKPRPAYSPEARDLQIEGEVLLEMLFSASGEACFVRLVQGLGHGLDESAIAAARAIRFRPAQRDGSPVDSPAIVHIVFQLAY